MLQIKEIHCIIHFRISKLTKWADKGLTIAIKKKEREKKNKSSSDVTNQKLDGFRDI